MLPDYLLKCLEEIGGKEYTKFEIETNDGSKHGDNFLGLMIAVCISGIKKDEKGFDRKEKLHLICKLPPLNESRKKSFKSELVFDREIYVYKHLLPAFVRFQQESGLSTIDSFLSFPKVYACDQDHKNETYTLIMGDLRAQNYEMFLRRNELPFSHVIAVMRELGKLHAVSFAMKDQRPSEFEQFKLLSDTFGQWFVHGKINRFVKRAFERAIGVLKDTDHRKIMENCYQTFGNLYDATSVPDEFSVIVHGDCWKNNFLYQYADADKTEVKSICLVDFQLSRFCSPAIDLLYFIFTSTDKKFRDKHFETLLIAYYNLLSDSIRKLGSNPNKLFTYKNLRDQLKRCGYYALVVGLPVIELCVVDPKDIANLDDWSERIEKDEDGDLISSFDEKTHEKYTILINDLLTDLVNYGLISNK